jgi:hypothetical protein
MRFLLEEVVEARKTATVWVEVPAAVLGQVLPLEREDWASQVKATTAATI